MSGCSRLTDGDANIGPIGHDRILQIIAGRAKAGVTLTTVGFGMGNYKDHDMEQLADKGNGNALYIDSLQAAKKAFAEQLGSTRESWRRTSSSRSTSTRPSSRATASSATRTATSATATSATTRSTPARSARVTR